MAGVDIRKCKYKNCNHHNVNIDIKQDDYKQVGRLYYHADCYAAKIAEEQKRAAVSADMQLIKNLWIEYINPTVVISLLFKVLKEYIDRGISSEYLVFVLQYCIKHRYNLNHPFGFKYYIDKGEIKEEYKKKQFEQIPKDAFVVVEQHKEQIHPKFTAPKKYNSFSSILGGKQ